MNTIHLVHVCKYILYYNLRIFFICMSIIRALLINAIAKTLHELARALLFLFILKCCVFNFSYYVSFIINIFLFTKIVNIYCYSEVVYWYIG